MSDWKASVSRRPLLAALGAAVGIGILGGAGYEVSSALHRRRGHTRYEDVLAGLPEGEATSRLGIEVLKEAETFDARQIAGQVRQHMAGKPLSDVLDADLGQDRMVETGGWVLPETLALLCGLAAKAG